MYMFTGWWCSFTGHFVLSNIIEYGHPSLSERDFPAVGEQLPALTLMMACLLFQKQCIKGLLPMKPWV